MTMVAPTLISALVQVPDSRARRGRRYAWTALLVLIVIALLCGANTQRACARWGQHASRTSLRRLGFTDRGRLSLATVHRVLHQVSVVELETILGEWLVQVGAAWRDGPCRWLDGIAIDGKTLRAARRLGARDVHLLSACCQQHALVLGQQAVSDTTGELGAIGSFLASLRLAGETVTFDAAFTQWLVAKQVVDQGGAYLMVVKANQPSVLHACVEATADHPKREVAPFGVCSPARARASFNRHDSPEVTATVAWWSKRSQCLGPAGTCPSPRMASGSLEPRFSARRQLHQDQHNPELPDTRRRTSSDHAAPHHPPVGQSFEVVARRTRAGESQIVIRRENGTSQVVPARWTLVDPPELKPELTLTPGGLRTLLSMVAELRCDAEVADAPAAPGGSVEHVQRPNPAPPGERLDRTASSIPPGPARAAKRRERCRTTLALPRHVAKTALVYVRQSTTKQVLQNQESPRRQYQLVDAAVRLGWPQARTCVIDEDLGLSGTSSTRDSSAWAPRSAPERLALCWSPRSRDSPDWVAHRVIELSAVFGTLIAGEDGLYDPSDPNDRLVLGLKGTLLSAELHIIRARMRGGLLTRPAVVRSHTVCQLAIAGWPAAALCTTRTSRCGQYCRRS